MEVMLFVFSEDAQNSQRRDMRTLDKRQRQNFEFHWQSVSALVERVDELISELHTRSCITTRQLFTIRKQPSLLQIKTLLEIVSRKSVADFDIFVSCLPDTVQHHVLNLMTNTSGK
jgi:hypothetical protein